MNRYTKRMRELNAEPGFRGGNLPIHLSEEQLQEAERKLGTRLPEDYREFVRDFGVFGIPTVVFPLKPNPDKVEGASLEVFNGIVANSDPRRVYDIVRNYTDDITMLEPDWSPNWIAISQDAGTGSVALSIKGEDKGLVYFYSCYCEPTLIADSFDEFMTLLRSAHDEPEAKEDAELFWSAHESEF